MGKAEGLSGGQQNKDSQVVQWVARMNELKEKENPGSTQKEDKKEGKKKSTAPLSTEEQRELDNLRGDNKKARTAKSKEVSDLKVGKQYIDACKVVKGLEPKNGFFVLAGQEKKQAPKEEKTEAAPEVVEVKKEKKEKAKKDEGAGISPAERNELEQLKKDIIDRKAQLKAEGLSGGQQNKDAQVVQW